MCFVNFFILVINKTNKTNKKMFFDWYGDIDPIHTITISNLKNMLLSISRRRYWLVGWSSKQLSTVAKHGKTSPGLWRNADEEATGALQVDIWTERESLSWAEGFRWRSPTGCTATATSAATARTLLWNESPLHVSILWLSSSYIWTLRGGETPALGYDVTWEGKERHRPQKNKQTKKLHLVNSFSMHQRRKGNCEKISHHHSRPKQKLLCFYETLELHKLKYGNKQLVIYVPYTWSDKFSSSGNGVSCLDMGGDRIFMHKSIKKKI